MDKILTARERFIKTLEFRLCELDRLPTLEWAPWWDLTLKRWEQEGLRTDRTYEEICRGFGLDVMSLINASAIGEAFVFPNGSGRPVIYSERDYERVLPGLYTEGRILEALARAQRLKESHDKGEIIIRLWLDGFFWHPRELFGIENHLYVFYDKPDLMHKINENLAGYNIRVVDALLKVLKPDMIGLAEDMSYNNGPMLSKELFGEFIRPYYQKVTNHIVRHGIKIFVDSDGDVESMIPWLVESGIHGIYPLERRAGVDINRIKRNYPQLLMMGGFDKTIISKGEQAMKREFERLIPAMSAGGYIASVDHQTPPEVSLVQYKTYLKLLEKYAFRAVND